MEYARDLFFNLTILTSFLSLGNQFFLEVSSSPESTRGNKILTGLALGVLGCILVVFGIPVTSAVHLDLRMFPVMISILYAGDLSGAITGLTIGTFRIVFFGLSMPSITAFLVILFTLLICGAVREMSIRQFTKWTVSTLASFLFVVSVYTFLIRDLPLLGRVIRIYTVSTVISAFFLYLLMESLMRMNRMFYRTKFYAEKDGLTGLNNVRQFDELFNRAATQAEKDSTKLSFLFIDIDYFKKVNDTYGHAEGNRVLEGLSVILQKSCRRIDLVSRNGGEEFSVVLPDCPLVQAQAVAERIRGAVEQHPFSLKSGGSLKITVSIGVSSYPESTGNVHQLVEHADMALYRAKRSGRNRVCFFRDSDTL
ncbi:GGDEF domain-containing protein [Caproicibacter sp.]|uniref:GGDEF domain-containing protein n=1 Tax=Caproicibacter sp. TaxID=2814884 RepID=UPI0039891620